MINFALGVIPGLRSRLRSGRIPDLLPRQLRRPRQQRTVLEALAEVGPAGMTPNSLEVTTELPESRLNEALHGLIAEGLVCRRDTADRQRDAAQADADAGTMTDPHDEFYLLSEHAGRRQQRQARFS
jgi:hypothetical protein